MRNSLFVVTTLFAFASAPAFAGYSMGGAAMPANGQSRLAATPIASACPPGQTQTSSTDGARMGCEIPNTGNGVKNSGAMSQGPCEPGRVFTGSTSGANGGCELAPMNNGMQNNGMAQPSTMNSGPCEPGRVFTGSTSGSNGGCELPKK